MPKTSEFSLYGGQITGTWPSHVSSSQRSWWTCRLKAALSSGARLRKHNVKDNKALLMGALIHDVLGQHYMTPLKGRSLERLTSLADACAFLEGWPDALVAETLVNAKETLRKFWKRYGEKDGIVPLGVEIPINVPLPGVTQTYVGYIDIAYEEEGVIIIEDWKTSATKIEPLQYTLMNPQGTDYLWAARTHLWPDREIELRYLFMTPYYTRRMDPPDLSIPHAGEELATLARERDELPITANRGYHCSSCKYNMLCTLDLTGAPIRDTLDRHYRRDDADHNEEAADAVSSDSVPTDA